MSFLNIHGLSKAYTGVQALRDVSFEVERGQVHALLGENGAGKSTLIKILSGVEYPDTGVIALDGMPFAPRDPKAAQSAGVATIFQVFNLLSERTVMHNVLLGKEPRSRFGLIDIRAMRDRTTAILSRLNAAALDLAALVGELRVGEKQIVEIAKALVNESRLLIMDEPTSALNQNESEALFRIIEALKASGVTILYVSHRLEEIFRLADAVTVLRDGMHISTHPIAEVSRDSLIEDMIGRKLTDLFPERGALNPNAPEVLRVESLSSRGHLLDVNFALHAGEVLAVAGLSGSGKTELGKALYGDLPIHTGTLTLFGKPYRPSPQWAIRAGMIYLPEDRKQEGVLQEMSVQRNISLAVLDRIDNPLGVINRRRERDIAEEQIGALDIKTPGADQLVANLSGGNQQKVALGKCLATEPRIFILMEPTQGIDIGVKFDLYRFIAEQAQLGHAVLLISSELNEILGLADRILVMRDGHIAAEYDGRTAEQADILRHMLGESAPASAVHPT